MKKVVAGMDLGHVFGSVGAGQRGVFACSLLQFVAVSRRPGAAAVSYEDGTNSTNEHRDWGGEFGELRREAQPMS
jgi:hypothetical protein